jgi:BlaI family penicillinase repressor
MAGKNNSSGMLSSIDTPPQPVTFSIAIERIRLEARTVARARNELTDREWELMDALWAAGQATATDIQNQMQSSRGWAYSTVKTMLDRLVSLGYVKSRRVGNVYEYSPKSKRPTVVGKLLDDVTQRIFGGSAAPLIQTLIERNSLTDDEVEQLRKMLDDYQQSQGR